MAGAILSRNPGKAPLRSKLGRRLVYAYSLSEPKRGACYCAGGNRGKLPQIGFEPKRITVSGCAEGVIGRVEQYGRDEQSTGKLGVQMKADVHGGEGSLQGSGSDRDEGLDYRYAVNSTRDHLGLTNAGRSERRHRCRLAQRDVHRRASAISLIFRRCEVSG